MHSAISIQVTIHYMEQISHDTKRYRFKVKKYGNLFLNELLEQEKVFEGFVDKVGDTAIDVHDVFYDFIDEVSKVDIIDMASVTRQLKQHRTEKENTK
jgi:hypothetical protein